MNVALRGNPLKPGPVAPRRFPRILTAAQSPLFKKGSGRLELAAAVTNVDNPLTARVIVNRLWLHHFGRALVRSPNNFGTLGEKPTHPRLLDWLAVELNESGWSLKRLHRLIVLSATYRMSSTYDAHNFAIDGDNRLIWRSNPRRVDVESWRDALLSVTGELESRFGGEPTTALSKSRRRTLYGAISRNGDVFESDMFLRLFDFPVPRASRAKRTTTTVPQQYLFLMNNPFMFERARRLAERLVSEYDSDGERVSRAYDLLYGRQVTDTEIELALDFLSADGENENVAQESVSRWDQYAQVLLSASEFMYVR